MREIFLFLKSKSISLQILGEMTVILALASMSEEIFLKATLPPPITKQFKLSRIKLTGKKFTNKRALSKKNKNWSKT